MDQSSEINLFKISSEAGIAAGVRRIIAYTSKNAFEYLRKQDEKLKQVRDQIKASTVDEIPNKIERLFIEERELRKQIEKLQAAEQGIEIEFLIAASEIHNGIKLISGIVSDSSDGMKKLREIADRLKQKDSTMVAILGVIESENKKPFLVVAVGSSVKVVNAGDVIKASADKFGGKGGGKPDFAQAGGVNAAGLSEAILVAKGFVLNKLKS